MKKLLQRALEQIAMTKSDINKYLGNDTTISDLDSFVSNFEGCGFDWEEDLNMKKEEFLEKWSTTNKDEKDFITGCDLVIIDGEKYIIEYCL